MNHKKKVGIVTHYYNSINYGGNLQAYALVYKLRQLGYDAEQIPVNNIVQYVAVPLSFKQKIAERLKIGLWEFLKSLVLYIPHKIKNKKINNLINNATNIRQKAIKDFNLSIPHNYKILVTNQNNCSDLGYDAYITGSDQVWNPECYCKEYFLGFVPSDKIKISYAASIGKNSLTDEEKQIFKEKLQDFSAISVRKKQDIDLIKDSSPCKPVLTLDSTLLLDIEEWDSITEKRLVEVKYIFCYFLGGKANNRKLVKQFAKLKGYKIVTLPHLVEFVKADEKFGDIKLYDISPTQFLSLIKYAEYVFTDSFHAVVFSSIFKKQYFVLNREENKCMSSRIYNITELTHNENRYCDNVDKENVQYLLNQDDIDYSSKFDKLEKLKEFSIKFLTENLG